MAKELARLFITIGVDDKEYKSKLKQLDKDLAAIGKTAMVAGAAIVAGIGAAVYSWAKAGDEIQKLSQKIDWSTESLSEWKHVLDISGADLSSLQTAVKTLSGAIVDAVNGLMTYRRAFSQLGLDYKELAAMKPEEQFEAVMIALAGLEDSTLKTALAVDLFGRSGMDLIPAMEGGATGIEALKKEAHDLGIVFDQQAADAAAEFQDTITRLKESMQGLLYSVAQGAAPAISNFAKTLTDAAKGVSAFAKEYPQLISLISNAVLNFGLFLGAIGGIAWALPKATKLLGQFGAVLGAKSSIAGIAGAGILVGVSMIVTGINMLNEVQGKFNNSQEARNKLIIEGRKAEAGLANEYYEAAEAYADAYEAYIQVSGLGLFEKIDRLKIIKEFREEVEAARESTAAQQEAAEATGQLNEKLTGMVNQAHQANTAAGVLGISLQDVIDYMVNAGREAEMLGVNWEYVGEDANKACLEMGISIFDVADSTNQLKNDVARLTDEYNRQVDAINDVADAAIDANNAQIDAIDDQISQRHQQRRDERNEERRQNLVNQIAAETNAERRADLEQDLADLLTEISDEKWENDLRNTQETLRDENTDIQENAQTEIDAITDTYEADKINLESRMGIAKTFWNDQKLLYDQDVINFQAGLDAKLAAAQKNALKLQAINNVSALEQAGQEIPEGFKTWGDYLRYVQFYIEHMGEMPELPSLPSFQGWEGPVPGPRGAPMLAVVHGQEYIGQMGNRSGGGGMDINAIRNAIREGLAGMRINVNVGGKEVAAVVSREQYSMQRNRI